ncbi:MAG TPA: polysaccharide pyruvyl transferase family protein [Terriglobia bacterium]|nr:polysaccharide pyruvyl transferase family protein [Terriglobia bacterium]
MMDQVLELWVGSLIEWSKACWMLGGGRHWQPGAPLELLVVAYNGARNTGEDVRVEETVRQIRAILGEKNVRLSVPTLNFELTRGYFGDARQVLLPYIFPPFLSREVPRYDGVVACLGPTFSTKFASAVNTLMAGALGIAAAQNKLSVAYGIEAGPMDRLLTAMVRRYCSDSLVVTRNEASRAALRRLNIPTELGTDTAWTFEPRGLEYGARALRDAGWDGQQPVLALCPINPFWWPVKPSLVKYLARAGLGLYRESHYRSIYFHHSGARVEAAFNRYLQAFARAAAAFRQEYGVFLVLAAMERLDRLACERLAGLLGGAPVFGSDAYDMYQLVGILRACHFMVSSRFHGIVTSMPGLVVSAGVTMDERIRNLMRDRGQPELSLEVDDPDLEEKLRHVLRLLWRDRDAIRDGIGRTVVKNLKTMARMGVYFEAHVQRRYPEFPVRDGRRCWEEYLPPLSPALRRLVETYGG